MPRVALGELPSAASSSPNDAAINANATTTARIRRLARARSYDFEPATLASDPDFNKKSLRGNIVLRWEYVRGSTLFVVWDLSQKDETRPGDFRPFRDLSTAFTGDAHHVVMVKVSYWLNR